MALKLTFWGVRGSLPSAPTPQQRRDEVELLIKAFLDSDEPSSDKVGEYLDSLPLPFVGGYGASTTCVGLESDGDLLVIDGGTGIRTLSETLLASKNVPGAIHIYMTHFHWDHVIGLPFFAPLFFPGQEIHFYSCHDDLEERIRGIFKKPHFPVPFETLGSRISFHKLPARKTSKIGSFKVTPYRLDHPDPCWGLKVQAGGKTYAHCVDTECTRNTREDLGEDLPLYQGIDLMYFDAQYSLPELAEKANWGHSAAQIGIDIAMREKIPQVLFAHHDPSADFDYILRIEEQAKVYFDWKVRSAKDNNIKIHNLRWSFAHEGMVVEL